MKIPTNQLSLEAIPSEDASNQDILNFVSTLNGYNEVKGGMPAFTAYVKNLNQKALESLTINDLRILLFARQRAHYSSGGGWGDHDPIMDEMRLIVKEIRGRYLAYS